MPALHAAHGARRLYAEVVPVIPGRVSVIIPSRNERFVVPTVQDLLRHAAGDVEVIVVLDGEAWPNPPLPDDPRVHVLRRNVSMGMRAGINAGAAIASGEWLLKCDAHVSLSPGYDAILKAECDRDWVVTLRRDRLDAEAWALQNTGKPPIDYHFLSNPFDRPEAADSGLHGTPWTARSRARADVLLDEEMSSQGSFYFLHRRCWDERVGPLNEQLFSTFWDEFQEVGLRCQLSGGRVMINKKATVLHLHKGRTYGRGYHVSKAKSHDGLRASAKFWMLDQWHPSWATKQHDLIDLIRRFWPVPTWPDDPERVFAHAREVLRAAA